MKANACGPYDYKQHHHIVGIAEYKGKSIRYRVGRLSAFLVDKKSFPDRDDIGEWCNIILEVYERRAKTTAHPCFRVPDDTWSAVHRYLDIVIESSRKPVIDLSQIKKKIRPESCYATMDDTQIAPTLFEGTDKEIFARGIDALLMNSQEIEGELEYAVAFAPYAVLFHYEPGKLERYFMREHKCPDDFIEVVDMIMEMKERRNKKINGPFIRIPDGMDLMYRNFIIESARLAHAEDVNIHNPRYLSHFNSTLETWAPVKTESEKVVVPHSVAPSLPEPSVTPRPKPIAIPFAYIAPPNAQNQYKTVAPVEKTIVEVNNVQTIEPVQSNPVAIPTPEPVAVPVPQPVEQVRPTYGFSVDEFEPKEGEQIGSGTALKRIASGGMGVLYKIYNPTLDVERAVKVLNMLLIPESQRQALGERIVTEAQISAKLEHPNIIEVYDVGVWKKSPFIEMQFIEGANLGEWIDRAGRIPTVASTALAILACDALNYAHRKTIRLYGSEYNGIVHRDLKPANIMLSSDGILKMMDFGIARPVQKGFHTIDGSIAGSLQYSGFEQLSSRPIDGRTDLFAFGAVMYEMLTGKKVFPQTEFDDLMKARAYNKFKPITDFNLKIPRDLTEAIQQCLQLEPEDRPDCAATVLEYLNYALGKLTREQPTAIVQDWVNNGQVVDDFSRSIRVRKREKERKSVLRNLFGTRLFK